jgi:putative ABC transport system permease protein
LDISHHSLRDYQIIVPRQLMLQAKRTQRIFNLVLTAIGGISLVVGGIGIMNVLLATISERTREIGIRRTVGATRDDIVAQFLAEALLLTICGGLIGIIAGFGCSLFIARFAGWNVAVSPITILLPLITSLFVGVCAGVYPAIKAGKMDPVQALRSA